MYVSARASILIKPGHIRVRSGSDPEWYPGQWVIRVSDPDPVSTLVGMQQAQYLFNHLTIEFIEKTECEQVKVLIILLMPI